jgi:hypothetical protein
MSTNTEKYLKANRQQLDVEFPDDDIIWSKIKKVQAGNQASSKGNRRIVLPGLALKIAASVIILIAISYVITDLTVGVPFNNGKYLSEISSEYANIEDDYIKTVKLKERDVREISLPDNEQTRSIAAELKQLDKIYNKTIADLKELGDNEKVVNTIFSIYERKIELLERMIIETNKADNYEKNIQSSL